MPRYSSIANFLDTTRGDLAGPIPAPHITRFVVRSDELLHSNMADPPFGAEEPRSNPWYVGL